MAFCPTCGAPSPATRQCPWCRAEAPIGVLFCRLCGGAIPAGFECPACRAIVPANARFCRACGGLVPVHRARRALPVPAIAVAAGVLAAVVVLGLGAFLFLRRGSETPAAPAGTARESTVVVLEPAPSARGENGFPVRPHIRLDHPGGASADVPGAEVLYGEYVDLKKVEVTSLGRAWQGDGIGWRFISAAGGPPESPITVSIPAGSAGPDARVVALGASGDWIPVPAQRSGAAFQVSVASVPAPWTLAVATPVPGLADAPVSAASAAEELYWSDREAWRQQETAWLATQDLSVDRIDPSLLAASRPANAPVRGWADVQKDLDTAVRILAGARANQDAGAFARPPASPATVLNEYRAGVSRLAKLRTEWVNHRYTWAANEGHENDLSFMLYNSDLTIEQEMESALALYAPWGVELIDYLLQSGSITSLDLRILDPYGEIYFTDVPIAKGKLSVVDNAIKGVAGAAGKRVEDRYLRLYSTRAIETTSWLDFFKDWKTEGFLRYLPVALYLAGITTGGPFLIALTAGDQLLAWWQNSYETASDPYVYARLEKAGTGLEAAGLFVDATLDHFSSPEISKLGIRDASKWGGPAMFVFSAAITYEVATTDWYLLKDIRALTQGSQGYCPAGSCNLWYAQNVPPIQVFASVRVPVGAASDYPAERVRLMGWSNTIGTGYGGPPNLHKLFTDPVGLRELSSVSYAAAVADRPSLEELDWRPYAEDKWPDKTFSNEPEAQAIRVGIPRTFLQGVKAGTSSAPLADYGLTLRLEAADGSRNIFELKEEAAPLPTDKKDFAYATVILRRSDVGEISGLPDGYEGPQQTIAGEHLKVKFAGRISATTQAESEWLTFDIEFTPKSRLAQLDPDDKESPRVHYFDAELSATVFGTYRVDKFVFQGGDPDLANLYQSGHLLTPGKECEKPGTCQVQVGVTRTQPAVQYGAALCIATCERLASSEPWNSADTGLSAPVEHVQYFKLEKNVLTGTAHVETGGDPSAPAVVYHWHDIKAEFKGTKLTGTITISQLWSNVVNNQVTSMETRSVTITFEATKVK